MSPLLRRLGVTRRRSRVDLEHVLEAAETDRDIARGERDRARADVAARAAERDSAHEAIGKVAAAAGRPGAPTRWNVEDLVAWAADDRLEAELIVVDEALAKAGAIPAQDRVEAIRDLAGTRGAPCRCEAFDDGVVDARIACGYEFNDAAPGWLRCCALPDGHSTPHQPALDPWCSVDLDGARCVRPAGHIEPCAAVDERSRGPVAPRCEGLGFWGESCTSAAGHEGPHTWGVLV